MMAANLLTEIEVIFRTLFAKTGEPINMAGFKRHELEGLHCEIIALFSPMAGDIAKQIGAEPCGQPLHAEIDLLAGSPDCWAALFPDGE